MKNKIKKGILSTLIENQVIKRSLEYSQEKFDHIKLYLNPSQDFMCARKAYFNLNHPRNFQKNTINAKDFTFEEEFAKEQGNDVHRFLQQVFVDSNISILNEFTLEDEDLKIRARFDSIVEINKQLYLVEIKSVKERVMEYIMNNGNSDMEHVKQIHIYFLLIDKNKDREPLKSILNGKKVDNAILLYVNKNNQSLLEFAVRKNNTMINDLKQYVKSVWDHYNQKNIPELQFQANSPECLYRCQYYDKCHPKHIKATVKLSDRDVWGSSVASQMFDSPRWG